MDERSSRERGDRDHDLARVSVSHISTIRLLVMEGAVETPTLLFIKISVILYRSLLRIQHRHLVPNPRHRDS